MAHNDGSVSGLTPPGSPRPSIGNPAASDISTDMIQQVGNLVGPNLPGMAGYVMLVFPKVMQKLAAYPRLAKLLSFLLTLALASYLNAGIVANTLSSAWHWFISLFTSSVTISGRDPIVPQIQNWLRKVHLFGSGTSMRGESNYLIKKRDHEDNDWDYDDEDEDDNVKAKDSEDRPFRMVLHSKSPLTMFRYGGRYFLVSKEGNDSTYSPAELDSMTFYCFGWSTRPIVDWLADIDKSQKVVQQERWTTIRTHEEDRYASWSRPQTKLARPISSVDLDEGQKEMIVNDIEEYLAPETKQWYQKLGIPYRRGYLFHGPPGTGKSSLAMALAGHFKLDIHVLSLLDKNMNDYTLNRLMKSMSGKPLVLLEDIDSAGVGREFGDEDDDDSDDESDNGWGHNKPKTSNVTLSGLLNAIDGVGAPEGQVLVMTTNHLEVLDDALVRAGRVDIKVKLDWSSKSQMRDIFLRMYGQNFRRGSRLRVVDDHPVHSDAALAEMAAKFADQVPEYQLSPAELQDFILMRKSDPQRALEDVKPWADKVIGEREEEEKRRQEKKDERKQRKKERKDKRKDDADSDGSSDGSSTPIAADQAQLTKERAGVLKWLRNFLLVEYAA
jgi:mitochondrial chaperone BCS1